MEKTKVPSVKARLAFISRMERMRSELFLKILVAFQVFFRPRTYSCEEWVYFYRV